MRKRGLFRNWERYMLIILVFGYLTIISCEKYSIKPFELDPEMVVSFETDILTIFDNNCILCHGGTISPDLRAENAYYTLIDNYISEDPESSRIYTKLLETTHGSYASEIDKQSILMWIQQGAENN